MKHQELLKRRRRGMTRRQRKAVNERLRRCEEHHPSVAMVRGHFGSTVFASGAIYIDGFKVGEVKDVRFSEPTRGRVAVSAEPLLVRGGHKVEMSSSWLMSVVLGEKNV